MGWENIATPETLDRASRLVAAMIGNLSQAELNADVFHAEASRIIDELDRDGDEYTRLLACMTAVAALAIQETARRPTVPPSDEEESVEEEALMRTSRP